MISEAMEDESLEAMEDESLEAMEDESLIEWRRASDPSCACEWCGTVFQPRTDGGTAQRFCKPACRRALDRASRAWVRRRLHAGLLSVADLRDGPGTARALLPEANEP